MTEDYNYSSAWILPFTRHWLCWCTPPVFSLSNSPLAGWGQGARCDNDQIKLLQPATTSPPTTNLQTVSQYGLTLEIQFEPIAFASQNKEVQAKMDEKEFWGSRILLQANSVWSRSWLPCLGSTTPPPSVCLGRWLVMITLLSGARWFYPPPDHPSPC